MKERLAAKNQARLKLKDRADALRDGLRGFRIKGAEGVYKKEINGTYAPTTEKRYGKPVFQKEDNDDMWVTRADDRSWRMTNTENKGTVDGWAASAKDDASYPWEASKWREHNGKKWGSPKLTVEVLQQE